MTCLQCHSKGDKRFSALYAKIHLFGEYDTIESFYQLSKRFNNIIPRNIKSAKGKYPTHLIIHGNWFPNSDLTAWYDFLWYKYFTQNIELYKYAMRFDTFIDIYASSNGNNQAVSIKKLTSNGLDIVNLHYQFCERLVNYERMIKNEQFGIERSTNRENYNFT